MHTAISIELRVATFCYILIRRPKPWKLKVWRSMILPWPEVLPFPTCSWSCQRRYRHRRRGCLTTRPSPPSWRTDIRRREKTIWTVGVQASDEKKNIWWQFWFVVTKFIFCLYVAERKEAENINFISKRCLQNV